MDKLYYRTRDILKVFDWIPRRTLLKRLYDGNVATRWGVAGENRYRLFELKDIVEIGIHEELIMYGFMERSSKHMKSVRVVEEFMLPIQMNRPTLAEVPRRKKVYQTGVVKCYPVPENWSSASFIERHDYEVVIKCVMEHAEGKRFYGVTYIPRSLLVSVAFNYAADFSMLEIDVKRIYNYVSISLKETSTSEIIV